ncbi:TetR/AcrR family transcriptional regulator [Mycobacterium paraintracellulare]|uniref:TetR/AcrR family transcriptional regulator n=1 Tax=Mycobacterium paraintracellulare TaxID=1138383 RepID=UPI0019158D07|nr:TetR/AcrR family transcriptional regulator [Mycobacterium paraintracellulare]BCP04652.1 TetR family transcriptional regulator [Mycobacterium paraintracellulare]BCP10017.1 TetR family transcriptional regulator [Mycobacterium paraintracellulare]
MTISKSPSAKERLIATAYDLFTRRGISDVGVDEIVAKAGVAKATLYKYFPSKEDLVLAFLAQREELWTDEVIDRRPAEDTDDPAEQLLATFDVLDRWFHGRRDYEAWSFVKILLEVGDEGRIGEACTVQLDRIRAIFARRARRAGLRNVRSFTWTFNGLIKGSIVCAAEGDRNAARRAKPMAAWLIEQHR